MDLANHLLVVRSQDVDGHLVKEGMGSGGGNEEGFKASTIKCVYWCGEERSVIVVRTCIMVT